MLAVPVDLNLDTLSRVVLVAACAGSAISAAFLAYVTHPKYTPHMILIAIWSVWAGVAMWTLAFEWADFPFIRDSLVVGNLNGAFTVALGGWAFFALRLWHEAVTLRKAETLIGRALQENLDENIDSPRIEVTVDDD